MKMKTHSSFGAACALAACLGLDAAQPLLQSATAEPPTLKFNFRGVPIETVLDYLSEAAGFIIVLETEVSGNINAWSNQPITSEDAVHLLDTILAGKGYAAVRNGRILKIVDQSDAHKHTLPVKKGSDPEEIPPTDQMVTQIIPVRYANAMQLIENLQPLLPEEASLTANESSNALVLTDRQASIQRIAKIITALDTSISGISTIRVFSLQFADATELEEVIEDIFEPPVSSRDRERDARREEFLRRFGRGDGDGRSRSSSSGISEARQAVSHVVAEADERTNSLVVAAPEETMPIIEEVVKQIDRNIDAITEIEVFRLQHADAVETAQILTDLFDDQEEENQAGFRFGRGGFFGREGGERRSREQDQNQRLQQQNTVAAVADPRTNSVIVSASGELMSQIGKMILQLDEDNSKKQKVYVYALEHADADNVAEILRGMFEDRLNGVSRSITRQNNQQNNPLNNRTVNTQPIRGAAGQ